MFQSTSVAMGCDSVGRRFVQIDGVIHVAKPIIPDKFVIELSGRLIAVPDKHDSIVLMKGITAEEIRKNIAKEVDKFQGAVSVHAYLTSGNQHLYDFIACRDRSNFDGQNEISEFLDSVIVTTYCGLNK